MKVWITKYALSHGIFEADAELCSTSETLIRVESKAGSAFYHVSDWHRSKAAAITKAEEMRTNKIASLQKQIAKLEKATFAGSLQK